MAVKNYILGTVWWTDCDDAVALRIAARAHKAGEICLRGVGINACMVCSVASLEGFLNLEGVEDVPVGIDLEATDFGGNPPYQKRLAPFAQRYRVNEDAEDAVRLYRRLLAGSDEPVEIIEIGFLQVMAAVLESLPDDISDKPGTELVREKVPKIWVMAGKWDEDAGREHNFARNQRAIAGAKTFCEKCPVPVTFLGWEVGASVISGGTLRQDDHLRMALKDFGAESGRSSWDPMLMVLALTGDEHSAGYDVVQGHASVDAETGANHFRQDENGLHRYVVKRMSDGFYRDQINSLIQ